MHTHSGHIRKSRYGTLLGDIMLGFFLWRPCLTGSTFCCTENGTSDASRSGGNSACLVSKLSSAKSVCLTADLYMEAARREPLRSCKLVLTAFSLYGNMRCIAKNGSSSIVLYIHPCKANNPDVDGKSNRHSKNREWTFKKKTRRDIQKKKTV